MGLFLLFSLLGWSFLGQAISVAEQASPRTLKIQSSEMLELKSETAESTPRKTRTKTTRPEKETASKSEKTSKKTTTVEPSRARLPRFYSQLDLAEDQRQEVLERQQQFMQQIAALREQIAKLQAERDEQLESLLKPAQKRRLKELEAEAAPASKKSRRD